MECGRIAADLLDLPSSHQFGRREHDLAAVARLHPASLTLEPHGARTQRDPVLLAEDQFGAVGVAADDPTVDRWRVAHRRQTVVHRPLAEIDAVRAPLQHAATDEPATLLEVEAVGKRLCIEWPPGCWAEVHVPVSDRRIGRRVLRQPAAGKGLHAGGMGIHAGDPPEPASPREFAGEGKVRQVPALRARLKHRAAPPHRVAKDQALGDVLGAGLLAVDVLAGLRRMHGHQAVPVGPRGNQHGVHIGLIEEFAEVVIGAAFRGAVVLVGDRLHRIPAGLLDVADRHELHVGLLEEAAEVVFAAAADADAGHADSLARRHGPVEAQRRRRDHHRRRDGRGRARHRPLQKPPPRRPFTSLHRYLRCPEEDPFVSTCTVILGGGPGGNTRFRPGARGGEGFRAASLPTRVPQAKNPRPTSAGTPR